MTRLLLLLALSGLRLSAALPHPEDPSFGSDSVVADAHLARLRMNVVIGGQVKTEDAGANSSQAEPMGSEPLGASSVVAGAAAGESTPSVPPSFSATTDTDTNSASVDFLAVSGSESVIPQITFTTIPAPTLQASVESQSGPETGDQTPVPVQSVADNAVVQSPFSAGTPAPAVTPSSPPVSEIPPAPVVASAPSVAAIPVPADDPVSSTVESSTLVTPVSGKASSQVPGDTAPSQQAPSAAAPPTVVTAVASAQSVESSPLVTPEEPPAAVAVPAPAEAAPNVPAANLALSSSASSSAFATVVSVTNTQPSPALKSALSTAQGSPVALSSSSATPEASDVAGSRTDDDDDDFAAPSQVVSTTQSPSSSALAFPTQSGSIAMSSSSSSSSSNLSISSASRNAFPSSLTSSSSRSASSSASMKESTAAKSSSSSPSSSTTSSSSSFSSRSSTTASASTSRSSLGSPESSSSASSVAFGSVNENSSVAPSGLTKATESASKETTGKSSLKLTPSQTNEPDATESASVETITTTYTSIVDRTRTMTITTTIRRTKDSVPAAPTARPVLSSSHKMSGEPVASVSPVHLSSSAAQTARPAHGSFPAGSGPEPEPTVTTTVITTVINNVTVTKTVLITITPPAFVPAPSSQTTQEADLGVTVVTSKSVGGGRTVTITVTRTTTIPRRPHPTPIQAPPSFSSIAPPVYATVVPSAPAPPPVLIETRWTTLITTLTTSEVQTVTTLVGTPQTSGIINTVINSAGPSPQPFNTTVVPTPVGSIQPITTGAAVISANRVATPSVSMVSNIFVPIGTAAPPSQISSRNDHPVKRLGITNQTNPPETNKFYGNFYLGSRAAPTWTHPYSVAWANGSGATGSWGLAISQTTRDQVVYGPGNPAKYYINPGGLQSMIISAAELGNSTSLTMDQLLAFSVNINLSPATGAAAVITFPLVQGMGFVTGIYNKGTPLLQSSIFFTKLTFSGVVSNTTTARYQVQLTDNTNWLIYLTPSSGSKVPTLTLTGNKQIVGDTQFTGSLQVAKNPSSTDGQTLYDAHAGVYPLRGAVQASTNKTTGNYTLQWTKGGLVSRSLLMFSLPHHQQSFDSVTAANVRKTLSLWTTTKGLAYAVVGDVWSMVETNLPFDMGFAPWKGPNQAKVQLSANAKQLITSVAASELNQDFDAQTNLDSMYFSGKALAKYAAMVWATYDVAGNTSVASAGLAKLKTSFSRFVNNRQTNPLVYDSVWGGAVSSATYKTGDAGVDFGNTYYNDHHFHYGYFVYTAAVIGSLDPSWLTQGTNKAWVNMLVRDYANPASNDGYFPFSRMFDWYTGHSWAHGLYETFDGKDEESSSEDTFSSYALKMWGRTVGDANMEARGNLMLSIQARSLTSYFLMQSNNTIQPSRFIGNKAPGITFENKIDHTTYFGANIEYIEGIHMLPINPSSMLTRAQNFVREEWNQYFSNGRVDSIAGGWRGILYSNLALIDPKSSWNFFANSNFDNQYLDGGASRTWYLAMAAGLGGAP